MYRVCYRVIYGDIETVVHRKMEVTKYIPISYKQSMGLVGRVDFAWILGQVVIAWILSQVGNQIINSSTPKSRDIIIINTARPLCLHFRITRDIQIPSR